MISVNVRVRVTERTGENHCMNPRANGGTGVSGLTRGLVTRPQGGSRSLWWSETGMEDPQEDSWQYTASVCVAVVHCWEIFR